MRPTNTESYESGLDSIRYYINYLKELAGTGATDEIEFALNRIGDYWGDILYQQHVTKPSPRARPATLRQFAETMQKKVDKLPQKDPRTAYLRPEVNPVTKKLKRTATEDLRSPAEKAFGLEAGEAYGEDETPVTDMGVLRHGKHVVEFSRNEHTSAVTGWVKGIGDICFASNKQDAVNAAKRFLDAYQAALDAGATEKDAKNQARAARDKKTANVSKGNPMTKKLKNTGRVVAALQKMIRKANEGESVLAPAATPGSGSDLEKDLQTLKAAAQKADAGRGTLRVTGGTKFGGGSITITYSGLPNTPRGEGVAWDNGPHALIMVQGYDKDGKRTAQGTVEMLRVHPRKAPFRQRKGDLGTVVAVTAKQLPALFDALVAAGGAKEAKARRTAAAEVNVRGDLLVYRDGGDGENVEQAEIPFNVTVPASDTYRSFIDRLQVALNEVADEPGYEVDLSSDVITDSDPLRLWLEAQVPAKHEATNLFYDWLCDQYKWGNDRDIDALSKEQAGFANTPYVFEYFEDDDALLEAYAYAFETDPEMYKTNSMGEDETKSASEQAEYIWGVIENSNDTPVAERDQLVTGDYFIIRYA